LYENKKYKDDVAHRIFQVEYDDSCERSYIANIIYMQSRSFVTLVICLIDVETTLLWSHKIKNTLYSISVNAMSRNVLFEAHVPDHNMTIHFCLSPFKNMVCQVNKTTKKQNPKSTVFQVCAHT
jgi:hypothetical protein